MEAGKKKREKSSELAGGARLALTFLKREAGINNMAFPILPLGYFLENKENNK